MRRITSRRAAPWLTVALIVAGVGSATERIGRAQAGDVLLTGTITSAGGEKMEGVVVSSRPEGTNITVSVYTDADGEYYFPPMGRGTHLVWAQAVGYDLARAGVRLADAVQRQDFVLQPLNDFEAQVPGDRWVDALPEETDEDRRMKTVFRVSCGGCHSQNTALLTRFDEKGWRNILTVMSRIATSGYQANALSPAAAGEDMAPNPLIDYYKERLAAYLAKVRGPDSPPLKFRPRPRPTGDAVLAVIREYDTPGNGYGLPLWENGSFWTEGAPSKTNRANHHAMDGTLDREGNPFFTDDLNSNPYRSVGKIDWKTGKITNIKVPRRNNPTAAASVHDLVADQNGIMWFGADGTLIRLDPATLKWEAMTAADGTAVPSGGFNAVDWKGGIWSATRGASRFDPDTRTFTQSPNPIQRTRLGSASSYGMAGDGNGNGWISQFGIDIMAKHDPVTGKSEVIELPPPPNAPPPGLFTGDDRRIFDMMGGSLYQGHGHPWMHTIRKPGGGPDAVWGPAWISDYLVKIDVNTHKVTLYPAPYRDIGNYQSVVDRDGIVWNALTNADAVAKFDPATEQWTWYDLPTRGTETHGLQVVTVNGRTQVAVPYWGSSKIAKLEFMTPAERDALKARARARAATDGPAPQGESQGPASIDARSVQYPSGSATIDAYLARPTASDGTGKHPAIIVVHDDQGLNDAVREKTRLFAMAGFVALAPNLASRMAATSAVARAGRGGPAAGAARGQLAAIPLERTIEDVSAAFTLLQKDAAVDQSRISAVGFGWGVWRVFKLAERVPTLHRAVVFYGTTSDDEQLHEIRAPILGHYAEFDFRNTAGALATKRRLAERFTYYIYPDTERGFFGGSSGAIDYVALVRDRADAAAPRSAETAERTRIAQAAAREAWDRTLAFLLGG